MGAPVASSDCYLTTTDRTAPTACGFMGAMALAGGRRQMTYCRVYAGDMNPFWFKG